VRRGVGSGLDAGGDLPLFEGVEEFVPVIGTIGEYPVHRVLLAAVLLGLIEERDEHLVVLYRFISDLQTENLVGLDVDHGVHLDPTAADPPLLAHPLPPVRDLDPGAISGDDDILSEELGKNRQREIETLDPAEERGIIGCFEARNECRGSPNKSLHLTVGHLQEGVNAGHPRKDSGY